MRSQDGKRQAGSLRSQESLVAATRDMAMPESPRPNLEGRPGTAGVSPALGNDALAGQAQSACRTSEPDLTIESRLRKLDFLSLPGLSRQSSVAAIGKGPGWMPGTSPGMTKSELPAPFCMRLARPAACTRRRGHAVPATSPWRDAAEKTGTPIGAFAHVKEEQAGSLRSQEGCAGLSLRPDPRSGWESA